MGSLVKYDWKTPVSNIPAGSSGRFHIVKRKSPAGLSFETGNSSGIEEVLFTNEVIFTQLKDNPEKKTIPWMSDTPMELYTAQDLAMRSTGGRILIGGLGLGLITHLLANRRDVTEIVVVEIEPDVIKLVKDYLPPMVKVIEGNFLHVMGELSQKNEHFDTIIADIWKTGFEDNDVELFMDCQMCMDDCFPDSMHLFWAFQNKVDEENLFYGICNLRNKGINIQVITTSGD